MLTTYTKIITCETPAGKISSREVGGKAFNLFKLRSFGFPVPDWFVLSAGIFDEFIMAVEEDIEDLLSRIDSSDAESFDRASSQIGELILSAELPDEIALDILNQITESLDGGPLLSIRSSVIGEDSLQDSFAGQMDSFLNVRQEDVLKAVRKVWASAFSARSLVYRDSKNISLSGISAAVIIQKMLQPETSGVLFTREPETSACQCHISAAYGLGEGVVSDRVITDTYSLVWDSAEITKDVAQKDLRIVLDRKKQSGIRAEALPADLKDRQVLTDERIRELCNTGIRIERSFGSPQDIEWACCGDGKLYILQSRPITFNDRKEKTGQCRIWDNSNIVESYPGLTLPLTFSFIRKGYELSFRRAIQGLVINKNALNGILPIFSNMLGLIDGRVYYNLLNWYKMLSFLPGFASHKGSWDQMIGIQEELAYPQSRLSAINRAYSCLKIVFVLLTVKKLGRKFGSFFSSTYSRIRDIDFTKADAQDLEQIFDELGQRFAAKWHLTLFNDFAAMKYFDWLKKFTSKWGPSDRPNIHNDLLCGVRGVESIEPLYALVRLAEKVRSQDTFLQLFDKGTNQTIWNRIQRETSFSELKSSFNNYLAEYGDRSLEDLKLEKAGYREEPDLLVGLVKNYYQSSISVEEMRRRESEVCQTAERIMRLNLKNPIKKWIYFFILNNTRYAIANRENMRFARSRFYGIIRQIFRRMGELFESKTLLESSQDIFYLTVDEVFGTAHASNVTRDLKSTVRIRKSEYQSFESRSPDERIITTGIPHLGLLYASEEIEGSGKVLSGIGCSSGIAEGTARVGFDPGAVDSDGKYILVAKSTDPGWVFLMISSAGIVAEKGSVLSHTAIIGRELGVPTIVGVKSATSLIKDGSQIYMDGAKGEIRCL